jgi:hypothetical protein
MQAEMPKRKHKGRTRNAREVSARERALRALSSMRRGASLSRAASENGVSVRTVQRYVGRALLQDRRGGRIRAAKTDRLVRYLQIPGPNGPQEIKVRGSKTATQVAKYKGAVNRFLQGDRNALAAWHGKKIAGIELITAESTLKSLAVKDLLPYSLYRSVTGGAV